MKMYFSIRSFLVGLLFFSLLSSVFANIAQPGIRNAGGTASFTLLFPEDSSAYQKIQMQKEVISIQLYKGFAVVKGEYWMYNSSDEDISMQSGYPIQATYHTERQGYELTEMYFDTLYQLKTYINGNLLEDQQISFKENHQNNIESYPYSEHTKWYTWQTEYPAKSITKIDVYFILETNNATILQGYNSEDYNGFIYVLETGATWKTPIGEGTIFVQLMDGLKQKDIHGISPSNLFVQDEEQKTFIYSFEKLEPNREANIVITYHQKVENFDFKKVVSDSENYFSKIDKVSSQTYSTSAITFNSPFDLPDDFGKVMIGIIAIVILIPLLAIIAIVYLIVRYVRKGKE